MPESMPLMLTYRVRFVSWRIGRAPAPVAWSDATDGTRVVGRALKQNPGIFAAVIENHSHGGAISARHHVGRVDFRRLAELVVRLKDSSNSQLVAMETDVYATLKADLPALALAMSGLGINDIADEVSADFSGALESVGNNVDMEVRAGSSIVKRIEACMRRYEGSLANGMHPV